jgi:cytochrome P450
LYENPSPTDESFSRLAKHIEGVLDINQWANKAAMDIIGVAGLGRQFNSLYSAEDELIDNYQEILEPSYEKGLYFAAALILPRTVLAALPWKLNQRLDETTASLRRICRQLLRDKTNLAKTSKEEQVDILSLLIKSNNFSDDMLVDEILTFLAAG